jgi:hypothetical protein
MKQKVVLTTPCEIIQHSFGLVFHPGGKPRIIIAVQHNGINPAAFEGIFAPIGGGWLSDLNVLPIAMEIYRKSFPNVVVVWNQFPRRFVDTNRSEGFPGFADERLKKYHVGFHLEVKKLLSLAEEPGAILLDLHGFTKQPRYAPRCGYDLILGTLNRQTVNTREEDPHNPFAILGLDQYWWRDISFKPDPKMMKKEDFDLQIRDVMGAQGLNVFCPQKEWYLFRRRIELSERYALVRLWDTVLRLVQDYRKRTGRKALTVDYSDEYDGGFLVADQCIKAIAPPDHVAIKADRPLAAIQIEINSKLRGMDRGLFRKGKKKRQLFIDALSGLINKICE